MSALVVGIEHHFGDSAVVRHCEDAAACIRAVGELATPDVGAIAHPSEAFRAVAALRLLTERLPAALAHIAIWFCDQVELEVIAIDVGTPHAYDPYTAAHELRRALVEDAIPLLNELADALDRAAAALAHASTNQSMH